MRCSRLIPALIATMCVLGCRGQLVLAADGETWRFTDVDRVVAVPDIHGAYPAFVGLLQATGLVDDTLHWTGGEAHLVSLGDLLDRGPESRKVMDLLMRLQQEAPDAGGRVHVIAGNHELMNLIGDLRYVSKKEFAAFADDESAAVRDAKFDAFRESKDTPLGPEILERSAFDKKFPPGYFAHRKAFMADGSYGEWLMSLPAFIVINDTAFVHGGLPKLVAETDPDEFNRMFRETTSRYLTIWRELIDDGILPDDESKNAGVLAQAIIRDADPSNCLEERAESCERVEGGTSAMPSAELTAKLNEFITLSDAPVFGPDGPLWYRGASFCRKIFARPILDASLENLSATNLVVGHTTTPDARVHLLHDSKLTMLDTGMLVEYYKGRPAALIIEKSGRIVQYLEPQERQAPVSDDYPEAYDLSRTELIKVLQNAAITSVDKAPKGSAWPVRLTHAGQEVRANFYPRGRNNLGEWELAAHALDQLLGFELMPLTVERMVNDQSGALQLRYPDALSERQRVERNLPFSGWCSMNAQFELLSVWDALTGNTRRTADNLLYRQQLWRVLATEHSNAFSTVKRLPKSITDGDRVLVIAPEVQTALSSLDTTTLEDELGASLNKSRVRALLSRRDALLDLVKE